MRRALPSIIPTAVTAAALRLGRALDHMEWPNGESAGPSNELNALNSLQWALTSLDPTFHYFAEASLGNRKRVDLLATNRKLALVIEAKNFGAINRQSDSALRDLARIQNFSPSYYIGKSTRTIEDWWQKSDRWALVLIASFRGREVHDAWVEPNASAAAEIMGGYSKDSDRPRPDGSGFMALRTTPDMHRFAAPIELGPRWTDTGAGYLLCGAISLGAQA